MHTYINTGTFINDSLFGIYGACHAHTLATGAYGSKWFALPTTRMLFPSWQPRAYERYKTAHCIGFKVAEFIGMREGGVFR